MQEPEIQVGLLSDHEILFTLHGKFHVVAPKGNPAPSIKVVDGTQRQEWKMDRFYGTENGSADCCFFLSSLIRIFLN